MDMIPPDIQHYLQIAGGVLLMVLGLSYFVKFFEASFLGKVNYWSGLEKVHFLFIPMTVFVTPLLVHTKPSDNNLIKTKNAGWVHLFWGPVFFLLSLMMMVSGADYIGLPGTQFMNFVLTCGRSDIPPAITYQPPFTYKFPILKKARRTVLKLITSDIYMDKKRALNPFDDSKKIKLWEEDEEDRKEAEEERIKAENQAAQQAAQQAAAQQKK